MAATAEYGPRSFGGSKTTREETGPGSVGWMKNYFVFYPPDF